MSTRPAVRPVIRGAMTAATLLTAAALALAACGGDETGETDGSSTAGTETTTASDVDTDDVDEGDTTQDGQPEGDQPAEDTTTTEADQGEDTTTTTEDGQGEGAAAGADLDRRLEAGLIALNEPGGVQVDQDSAACSRVALREGLDDDAFEAMTLAIEENRNFTEEDPVTADDVTTIAVALSDCLDLSPVTADVVSEFSEVDDDLLPCLEEELGPDRIEALATEYVLGEEVPGIGAPLYDAGLDVCPDETTAVLAAVVEADLPAPDRDAALDCLAELPVDAWRELVDGSQEDTSFDGEAFVARNCG